MDAQCMDARGSRRHAAARAREEDVGHTLRRDPDWGLVEGLRAGTATAAGQLIFRYGDRAYRMALCMMGNQRDAEEVVEDALWAVVLKIDSFREDASFGSWFYRILASAAYQK